MAARSAFGASGTVSVVEGLAYVVFGTRLVKRIGGKPGGNDKSAKIVHISARCGGALFLRGALALAIAIAPHETLLSSAQGALWLALLAPQIVEIGVVLCLTWESACAPRFVPTLFFQTPDSILSAQCDPRDRCSSARPSSHWCAIQSPERVSSTP